MLFQVVLAVAILSSLIIATPMPEPDWTYLDVFEYLVKRGGTSNPTAQLIERHIDATGRDWNEVYQHDITGPGDAILTVDNSPAGRALKKRGYPAKSITGYPFSGDCSGPIHYTWDNAAEGQCFEYWSGNVQEWMSSVKVTNFDRGVSVYMYSSDNCGGYVEAVVSDGAHQNFCASTGRYSFASFSYLYS